MFAPSRHGVNARSALIEFAVTAAYERERVATMWPAPLHHWPAAHVFHGPGNHADAARSRSAADRVDLLLHFRGVGLDGAERFRRYGLFARIATL